MRSSDPSKYTGVLLKRKKYISSNKYWVVLSRGYLILYQNRNDAQNDKNRKGTNGLKNAKVKQDCCHSQCCTTSSFTIKYGCGKKHTFYTVADKNNEVVKRGSLAFNFAEVESTEKESDKKKLCSKWVNAIKEHINYWKSDTVPKNVKRISISTETTEKTFNIDSIDEDTEAEQKKKNLPQYLKKGANRIDLLSKSRQQLFVRSMQNLNLEEDERFVDNSAKLLGPSLPNLQSFNDDCDELTETEQEFGEYSENDMNLDFFSCRSRFSTLLRSSKTYKKFNSRLEKLAEELDSNGWRLRLPAKQLDRSLINIWSIAKYLIGKEIGISLPVNICEPLSLLQRISESFEYSCLLNKASEEVNPIRRLELISAYALSTCSSTERFTKPFNSLLGETYELVREDIGFKSISEQVSHHPPISAFQTESLDSKKPYWKCYGEIQPKVRFYGNSLGIEIKGLVTVEFPELKETYTWRPSNYIVHNVIVGSIWFEYYGSIEIECHQTKYKSVLNFRPYSRINKEINKIDGYIYNDKSIKLRALCGDWSDSLYSCDVFLFENYLNKFKQMPISPTIDIKDCTELWRVNPKPEHSNEYYNFSYFAMSLNQLKSESEEEKCILPPTDSRFRPDLRQLELGNIDLASNEKHRLEEKQRHSEKNRVDAKKGQWFEFKKHPYLEGHTWIFNAKYWLKDFSKSPNLF